MDASALLTFVLALQGVSLIVLALFAPFAIGILISYFTDTKPEIKSLEQRILLTQILRRELFIASLLALIILPFFAPLIFEVSGSSVISFAIRGFAFIPFVIWGFAIFYFLLKIRHFYQWLSDKNSILLDYFSGYFSWRNVNVWKSLFLSRKILVVSLEEKVKSWRNLWKIDFSKQEYPNDDEFFACFAKDVDSLLQLRQGRGLKTSYKLLCDFSNMDGTDSTDNMDRRDERLFFPYNKFLPKILEWHYQLWELDSRYEDNYRPYINLPTEKIIGYVTEKVFDFPMNARLYFKYLQTHIDKYKAKRIGKNNSYITRLINTYRLILSKIVDSQNPSDFLQHRFPKSWLITVENLNDPFVRNEWLFVVREWFSRHIDLLGIVESDDQRADRNRKLDAVNSDMFPEIHTYTWAEILVFYVSEFRLVATIANPPRFGFFNRIFESREEAATSSLEFSSDDKQQKATIELAVKVFDKDFTVEKLNGWIENLENLKYEKGSPGEQRKDNWHRILIALRDEAERQKQADSADEQADSSAEQTD